MVLGQVRRILVPTDFSDTAAFALKMAATLAAVFHARVEVVHAIAPNLVLPPPIDMLPMATIKPSFLGEVQMNLAKAADDLRSAGITVETSVLHGNPHVEIVRRAQETGADLVVMGTHGRSGLAHAVLGSIAERVVQKAHCPVLTVPSRPSSSQGG